jgi:hypothetical protein
MGALQGTVRAEQGRLDRRPEERHFVNRAGTRAPSPTARRRSAEILRAAFSYFPSRRLGASASVRAPKAAGVRRVTVKLPFRAHECYAEIARLVAGEKAPPWLADHFRRWIPSLYLDRHVAAQQPTRAQMRRSLEQMAADPEFAEVAASEIPVREFLESPPLGTIEEFASAEQRAEDLRRARARSRQ